MNHEKKTQAFRLIRELEEAGYAILVFEPSELGKARPKVVKNALLDLSSDVIKDAQD